MSPENTHKLMDFYMEVLILSVMLQYMVSASLSFVPTGCIGLKTYKIDGVGSHWAN